MKNLSKQIFQVFEQEVPDLIITIVESNKLKLGPAAKAVPYMQKKAYEALLLALKECDEIVLDSVLRLPTQQLALYKWYLEGLCGITLAEKPGRAPMNQVWLLMLQIIKNMLIFCLNMGLNGKEKWMSGILHMQEKGRQL